LDPPILFIIGSGDQSDRIAQTGATTISVAGSSDLHRLLLDSDPYELLHVSRNVFRQTRETRLFLYASKLHARFLTCSLIGTKPD